jgi:hypothetical protein
MELIVGNKWVEELRYVQSGRKICNPNTAFTCNLIEFGKLLNGEWSRKCLLFRCAHHLPHDMSTSVMKLCVDPLTRILVPPDLNWFNSKGIFLIRPGEAHARCDGSPEGRETMYESLVYLWVGDEASETSLSRAEKLVEYMRGILFDVQASVEVVLKGQETVKFLSLVQRECEIADSETPLPRPTFTDFWDDAYSEVAQVDAAEAKQLARERAVRGLGSESDEQYVYAKPQSDLQSNEEDSGSVVSDLAFSEDEDMVFSQSRYPSSNVSNSTGQGFSLSLPPSAVSRSLVLSALTSERSSDSSELISFRNNMSSGRDEGPEPSNISLESSAQESVIADAQSNIVIKENAPIIVDAPDKAKENETTNQISASFSGSGSGKKIPLPSSSSSSASIPTRLAGIKRFNVPSLYFSSSPSSSGQGGSNSVSNESSGTCSPSTSRSSVASGVASEAKAAATYPLSASSSSSSAVFTGGSLNMAQLPVSDRLRGGLVSGGDIRRQYSPATSTSVMTQRERSGSFNKNFFAGGSPRSTQSPKSDRIDSTRIPVDIGLARGATPVQDLLPSSARILKKSRNSTRLERHDSGNFGSDQSLKSSSGDRLSSSGESRPASVRLPPALTQLTPFLQQSAPPAHRQANPSQQQASPPQQRYSPVQQLPFSGQQVLKERTKPTLYVLDSPIEKGSVMEWTAMKVYDDDDLSDVSSTVSLA